MGIPSNIIIMWSGTLQSVPSGWLVCNGSTGTPDLRDRFVVAAGSSFAFNATGGFADSIIPTHNHTVTSVGGSGNHSHTFRFRFSSAGGTSDGVGQLQSQAFNYGGGVPNTTQTTIGSNHTHPGASVSNTGVSPTNRNIPPYYSLFYIMKGGE